MPLVLLASLVYPVSMVKSASMVLQVALATEERLERTVSTVLLARTVESVLPVTLAHVEKTCSVSQVLMAPLENKAQSVAKDRSVSQVLQVPLERVSRVQAV